MPLNYGLSEYVVIALPNQNGYVFP